MKQLHGNSSRFVRELLQEETFPSELRALVGIYVIGQEWLICRQRGILFRK